MWWCLSGSRGGSKSTERAWQIQGLFWGVDTPLMPPSMLKVGTGLRWALGFGGHWTPAEFLGLAPSGVGGEGELGPEEGSHLWAAQLGGRS